MDIALPVELAMVTDAVANFTIEVYINAIVSLVHEQVYATKSFNNKYVFFFVSSQQSAGLLSSGHSTIRIKRHELIIRPAVYLRIQLCDVPDEIRKGDIKKQFNKLKVNLLSEIKDAPDKSSDKIMYVHPSDNDLIPVSMNISNRRNHYQVKLRRCMICSICYDRKHEALDCPAAKDDSDGSSDDDDYRPMGKPNTSIFREDKNYNTRSTSRTPATDNSPNAPDKVTVGSSKGSSDDDDSRPIGKPNTSMFREDKNYDTPSTSRTPAIDNDPNDPDKVIAGSSKDKEPHPITEPNTRSSNDDDSRPIGKPNTSMFREDKNYDTPSTSKTPAIDNDPNDPDKVIAGSSKDKEPLPITEPNTSTHPEEIYTTVLKMVNTLFGNNPNALGQINMGISNDGEPHPIKKLCIREQMDYDPDQIDYAITLAPMREEINANNRYPLNFDNFVSLLHETYGCPRNALRIARRYTNNINALMYMITRVKKSKDPNTNSHLTRLYNALEMQLAKEQKYMFVKSQQQKP